METYNTIVTSKEVETLENVVARAPYECVELEPGQYGFMDNERGDIRNYFCDTLGYECSNYEAFDLEYFDEPQTICKNKPSFYTPNGWQGAKYDSKKGAKEVAKELRAYIKANPDLNACKWSITSKWGMYADSLYISLMAAPFDPFTDEYKTRHEYRYNRGYSEHGDIEEHTTSEAYKLIQKVKSFVMQYIHDDSDGMIDYFDRNIYDHYEIGKYDKPFQIIEKKESKKQSEPMDEPNESKAAEPVAVPEGLEIVDYSEKAIAVFGETKSIKDELKKLGGKFNPALKNNGEKRAGWIFPKKQADKVRALLAPAACVDPETSQTLKTKEEEVQPVVEHYFVKKKTDLEQLIESGDLDSINEMIKQKEEALNNAMENVNYYKEINNIEFMENEEVRAGRLQCDLELLKTAREISNTRKMDFPAYGDSETSQILEQEEQGKELVKLYNIMFGVGKAKYVVNYHDGVKKYNDGSRFYDTTLFSNKLKMNKFIKFLKKEGYKLDTFFKDQELVKEEIEKREEIIMDSPAYGDSETSQTLEQEEQEEENQIRERFPLEGVTVEENTTGPNGMIYFTVEGAGPVTEARVRADLNPGDTFNVCTKDDRRYVVTYDGVSLNRSIWNELPDIVEYEEKYYPEDCPTDADGNRFYTDTREDYAPFPYVVVDRLDGSVWFFTDSEDEAKEWATDYNREYCEGGKRKTQPGATYEVTRADRSKCAG